MYAFTSLWIAEINCTRITILTISRDVEAFTVITDIWIPAADIHRTRVAVITRYRRKCAFTRNRVTGVFSTRIAIIARRHIGAGAGKRVTTIQRAGIGIIAGWFMYAFSGLGITVILCAGIAVITLYRDMDTPFFPVPAANVDGTRVAIIAIQRRERAFARNRIAGVYGAEVAIVARGKIAAFTRERVAIVHCTWIIVVAYRFVDALPSNGVSVVSRTWIIVFTFARFTFYGLTFAFFNRLSRQTEGQIILYGQRRYAFFGIQSVYAAVAVERG